MEKECSGEEIMKTDSELTYVVIIYIHTIVYEECEKNFRNKGNFLKKMSNAWKNVSCSEQQR